MPVCLFMFLRCKALLVLQRRQAVGIILLWTIAHASVLDQSGIVTQYELRKGWLQQRNAQSCANVRHNMLAAALQCALSTFGMPLPWGVYFAH